MQPDSASLLAIAVVAGEIIEFTGIMDEAPVVSDCKTQLAVISLLEIIGDATERIPREFRAQHPEVPWHEMAATRDRLIHGYDQVRISRVWETATTDIRLMLAALEPLLFPRRS